MNIDEMLDEGICERGNYAFHNEEGCAVLFARVDGRYWLQSAYSPMNYPSWEVSKFQGAEENLINHINENLGGWYIDKTQRDLNESDGFVIGADDVVDDVANHVMNKARNGDYDPTQTTGALYDAIMDSATVLSYLMTQRMLAECAEIILESS